MNSNSLIKKVLVLVFLLVILIAVFALQGNDFGEGYFSWLKTKLTGMGPELNLAEEDSGLDLTDIKIENINFSLRQEIEEPITKEDSVVKENPVIEEEPIVEIEEVKVIKVIPETSGPSMTEVLLEIEQEINQIAEQIEEINNEIRNLLEITI